MSERTDSVHSPPFPKTYKIMRQRIVTMLVAMLAILPTLASDLIKAGESYYRIVDNDAYYVGESMQSQTIVIIPEKIEYNHRKYTVVGFKIEGEDYPYPSRCEYVEEFYLPSTIRNTSDNISFLRYNTPNLKALHVEAGGDMAAQGGALYTSDMKTLIFLPCSYTGVFTVPESVTALGEGCCRKTGITGIALPSGLLSIGTDALYETGITDITLPGNLQSIGDEAFYGTGLASITFPESLKSIGDNAFCGTKITRLVVPDNVVTVGRLNMRELEYLSLGNSITRILWGLPGDCPKLREMHIPASVVDIVWGAFDNCPSLTAIVVADDNPCYVSDNGVVLYDKARKELLFTSAAITEYVAPPTVTTIGYKAFRSRSKLKTIDLSASDITAIGKEVFCECTRLETANLSGVKTIEKAAFKDCISLKSVYMPDVTMISDEAFYGCTHLQSIDLPGETTIGLEAFYRCTGLKSLDLSGVTTVGNDAFYDCTGLEYINTGDNLVDLGDRAFACERSVAVSPRVIVLSNALADLPANAFSQNVIRAFSGGNGLKAIGDGAFSGCEFRGMQEIFVPYNVENIGANAYAGIKCDKNLFTKIYIGDKVTQIGDKAFDITQSVMALYCAATTPPQCPKTAFSDGLYAVSSLMVPDVEAYEKVFPWYKFMKSSYYDFSGVEEVADGGEEFSVSCSGGEMRVECGDGTAVMVWSADGREAYSGTGCCSVALPRGIYIVRAGSSTRKVIL